MKKFSVNLIENNRVDIFSIDSKECREFTCRGKSGILRRFYDGSWTSSAIELGSIRNAADLITKEAVPKFSRERNPGTFFDPGKIIRENWHLIQFLSGLKIAAWKVRFRSNSIDRIVINNKNKIFYTNFLHYSILVKVKPAGNHQFVEIGEGNIQGAKFNQTGLISRMLDILENYRGVKKNGPDVIGEKIPIVLGPGDGGIVFHEILGHSLEADHIYQNLSVVTRDDLGKKIVSPLVNISIEDRNDPFFKNRICDDEGENAGSPVLIEKGILRNLISDFFYQELLKISSAGHCRVQDFTRIPQPRMYSLYLLPGKYDPEELIESTRYGIFAKEFGDGRVFFNKNMFYFNIKSAYLIQQGKITCPLGSIVVSGNIIEILNSVDMIANDFRYDRGISYCVKNGQTLNVRVGQPSVKINNLYVSKGYHD
jgi:predicted Zn-dependent protease